MGGDWHGFVGGIEVHLLGNDGFRFEVAVGVKNAFVRG